MGRNTDVNMYKHDATNSSAGQSPTVHFKSAVNVVGSTGRLLSHYRMNTERPCTLKCTLRPSVIVHIKVLCRCSTYEAH